MSSLPSSWVTAPLGAFTSDCGQRVPEETETFSYIDIGSVNRETKRIESPQRLVGKNAPSRARKHVQTGDVLVSMTRPNLNAVALVPNDLDGQIASTGFDVLRATGVDPRWVYYLVRTTDFVETMSALVQGALYPAVRSKDVRGFEAPLAPLNEQKRIADKLDNLLARVDACRDRLDRIPAILKRFRQSVLATATSGTLTEDWRQLHDDHGSWVSCRIGDVTANSFYGPRFGKADYTSDPSGIPTVRTTDMTSDGRIEITSDTPRVFVPGEKLNHFRAQHGDLLVTRTGSIGVMAVFEEDYIAIPSAYLIRFRFSSQILPRYAYYCLSAPAGQEALGLSATAITQPNVNAEAIKRIDIELPSVAEQVEIVRRVESLFAYADRFEARYHAARTQIEILTTATLAKAFRGELVPQDPKDEPASALQALIKKVRADEATQPRARKAASKRKAVRVPKEDANMTKSRQDGDVKGHPYLAGHLRQLGGSASAEALFKVSDLPVADFYKQLAWEVDQGHVRDGQTRLELPDAT